MEFRLIREKMSSRSYCTSDVFLVYERTGKPVRCMLDRNEDMISTGKRHPFLAKYKVHIQYIIGVTGGGSGRRSYSGRRIINSYRQDV